MDLAADLRRRWQVLVDDLGLADGGSELGDDLLDRWQEPHRGYHGIRHLVAVLDALGELSAPRPPGPEVRAAAWFHDAIYEGTAGEDEERSAQLAETALAAVGCPPASIDAIAAMVRATAGHLDPTPAAEVDADTALLLDADLAILAADPDTYDAYTTGVRAEHADVPDAAFADGRRRALRSLLDRPVLFHSDAARDRYEDRARANLARELALLSAGRGGAG